MHQYPPPVSENFWRSYAEREDQFLRIASGFADTVRTLGRARSAGDATEVSDADVRQGRVSIWSRLRPLLTLGSPSKRMKHWDTGG